MKKTTTVIIFFTLWHLSNATVRTVSNMPSGPGQFATLTAAQAASSNDDTLLIHGTAINHGDFTLTKRLVLIGAGNWQNTAFTEHYSYINTFHFDKNANGSKVIGIVINKIRCVGNSTDTINDLLIEECYIGLNIENWSASIGAYIPWTNVTIRNCIFDRDANNGTSQYAVDFQFNYTTANIQLENCIFDSHVYGKGLIFNHCLFLAASTTSAMVQNVTNSLIENCMFIRQGSSASLFNTTNSINNTYNNNLVFNSTVSLPYTGCNGTGNITGNPLFISASTSSFFNIATDYHLQSSSPAKNAATDGTDIGVYGGSNQFSTVLEPLMTPIIRQFTINNPAVTPGGTLNINVLVTKPIDE